MTSQPGGYWMHRVEDLYAKLSGRSTSTTERTDEKTGPEREPVFHVVGAAGFEPVTSASRTQRSTKLSYIPNWGQSPGIRKPGQLSCRGKTLVAPNPPDGS